MLNSDWEQRDNENNATSQLSKHLLFTYKKRKSHIKPLVLSLPIRLADLESHELSPSSFSIFTLVLAKLRNGQQTLESNWMGFVYVTGLAENKALLPTIPYVAGNLLLIKATLMCLLTIWTQWLNLNQVTTYFALSTYLFHLLHPYTVKKQLK